MTLLNNGKKKLRMKPYYEVIKQYQNLLSWLEFYKQNARTSDAIKTVKQIDSFQSKHGIVYHDAIRTEIPISL